MTCVLPFSPASVNPSSVTLLFLFFHLPVAESIYGFCTKSDLLPNKSRNPLLSLLPKSVTLLLTQLPTLKFLIELISFLKLYAVYVFDLCKSILAPVYGS